VENNKELTMTVIVGDNIQRYRLLCIKSALKLESMGMKGRVNAAVIARDILAKAGIRAARNKKELLVQFTDYLNNGGLDNVGQN
jgi:hypothetical protein